MVPSPLTSTVPFAAVAVVVTVPSTSPASKLMLVVPSSATVFVLYGKDTITVTVIDDDGLKTIKSSSITVNDVNDAPTLTVDSTKTVAEDGTTSISFEAGDVDGTVTTTATAANGTVSLLNHHYR
jgi:hypothetical protein